MPIDPFTASLLASGAAGLGQAVAGALPTKANLENRRRLKLLLEREKTGRLGLTGTEREVLGREQMQPARILATENRQRQEAASAALGQSDAAGLARLREGEQQALAGAAQQAGSVIGQADLQAADAQRSEIEARLDAQAQRRTDVTEGLFGAAGQIAQTGAGLAQLKQLGLVGAPIKDFGQFRDSLAGSGFDVEAIDYMEQIERTNPGKLTQILTDTAENGPLFDARIANILSQHNEGGFEIPQELLDAAGGRF